MSRSLTLSDLLGIDQFANCSQSQIVTFTAADLPVDAHRISMMKNIRVVQLNCELLSPEDLRIPGLSEIYFGTNVVVTKRWINYLAGLRRVEHIRIKNGSFDDEDTKALRQCPRLSSLWLTSANLSGRCIEFFPLDCIWLESPKLTDKDVTCGVARNPANRLVTLYLMSDSSDLSDDVIEKVMAANPNFYGERHAASQSPRK